MITKHGMGNPLDASPGSLSAVALSLKTAEAEIELEKWKLFKKEIDFDKKTIHVHYNNLLTHQWTTASERDRWRTKVRKDHGLAAKKVLASHASLQVMPIRDQLAGMIEEYKGMKASMARSFQVNEKDIVTVALLNLSAPALIGAVAQRSQVLWLAPVLRLPVLMLPFLRLSRTDAQPPAHLQQQEEQQ